MTEQAHQPVSAEAERAMALGMPPCKRCGGRNVRTSHPAGLKDAVRAVLYRCRVCQFRFIANWEGV